MGYIQIEKDHSMGVAVVWLDQPGEKINKLSLAVLDEFKDVLNTLEQDKAIKGVVIISKKPDCFIAGADLEEIQAISEPSEAEKISHDANRFLQRLANFSKPVVAAINGSALGGGMEMALACHYRIASDHPKTVLALPEVKLGLLPAAGGTQRLPRLIGLQKALSILLTGGNVYPGKAKKLRLVDDVIHPYGLLRAAKIAAVKFAKNRKKRKTSLTEKLLEGNPLGRKIVYNAARKQVQKTTGGHYPAPFKILECVKIGLKRGIAKGLQAESKNFGKLVCDPVSGELTRLFFAMNTRKKNPYPSPHALKKMGILGAGFMGAGIAEVISTKQRIPVLVKDIADANLEYLEKTVWRSLSKKVKKRALTPFERDILTARIFPATDYTGFAKADMIIEAIFEDIDLKRKVLAETEEIVRDDCIIASNTSCIPIGKIAENAKCPQRVIGTHYFSPVPVMPLLEIIVTDKTADWVLASTYQMAVSQGKTAIVVKDGPGFYTTRILSPFLHEAIILLEEGAEMAAIDKAMKQFGFPVGPITLMDEVGIDVAAHVSSIMGDYFCNRGVIPGNTIENIVNEGFKGRKSKKGFYLYDRGKTKRVNEEMYRFFGGTKRKTVSPNDIQERLSMIMLNEAAYCLQEEIIHSPDDGDVGAILGMGFPPFHGGPFRYMDSQGLDKVAASMEKLTENHGERFTPAPLIKEMAGKSQKYYQTSGR